ncbi:hypothetical protein [Streptomyces longisporoflavus]|uniref:Uncharacterized protein n=1 Tax=Streptomyces longisporoflavus TaxID=28044 RepID=A0ABW7QEX6_9ACTN
MSPAGLSAPSGFLGLFLDAGLFGGGAFLAPPVGELDGVVG